MTALPQALYRAAEVRELDRIAIHEMGIPGITLMNRAGEAVWRQLQERWPRAHRIVVLCGTGNNGGDGFVVARLAREAGRAVSVSVIGEESAIGGDARHAFEAMVDAGVRPRILDVPALEEADVLVDALLGTGLDRPLAGAPGAAVTAINGAGRPVIAVDVPTGLHADTGRVLGVAVRACHTVTFIGLKQGLFTATGPELTGTLSYDDLGIPAAVFARVPAAALRIVPAALAAWLPPRPPGAHKGQFGHVLVVGGAPGMGGAARLAACAAARSGAGLVSIATHPEHAHAGMVLQPELMCHGISVAAELEPLLARATVVVVGPGLGRGAWARSLLSRIWQAPQPLVVDADALNALAAAPRRRTDWVLTPHPGEAARLLGSTAAAVQADRFAAVRALQAEYGGVAVLKGNGTVICAGDGPLALCDRGNPGMASGGMGDVLSGLVGGLLAQGLALSAAAQAGVYVHALAGDRAAGEQPRGMVASDLLPEIRVGVNPR
ncbi:MAG TPA: NAD(P)H-hydrate dehydratase [Gammaproteobacteria bacterium]|nr:NAD(P)H-hydrate dehydratase [Gammaproteobacteria bacterium]